MQYSGSYGVSSTFPHFNEVVLESGPYQARLYDYINVDFTANLASILITEPVGVDGAYFAVRVSSAVNGCKVNFGVGLREGIPIGRPLCWQGQVFTFVYSQVIGWTLQSDLSPPSLGYGSLPYGYISESRAGYNSVNITVVGVAGTVTGAFTALIPGTGGGQKDSVPAAGLYTTAGIGNTVGFRDQGALQFVGNNFNWGGFLNEFYWSVPYAAVTQRWFIGIIADLTAPTNVDPSTLQDVCGVCCLDGSNNVNIVTNDNIGLLATTQDLGASFPARTASVMYRLRIFNFKNSNEIELELERLDDGNYLSTRQWITSDLPTSGQMLGRKFWCSNNLSAFSCGFNFSYWRTSLFV